ncbi:MAG: transglycosylase SLT domain-containing protein [Pseudomonadota bacterium]
MTNPAPSALILPQAGYPANAHHTNGAQAARPAATRQIAPATGTANGTDVEDAIAKAAQSTTIDFDYLLAQAKVESALDPNARAPTSSAAGLYQFIESTWLGTVKRHGARFGMDEIAAQISTTSSGAAYVADPAQRAAILNLRNDPEIASLMAAGLAEDNRGALMPVLGRQPEASELYLAHFLGASGAGRFLSAMQSDPNQGAASLFRRPAAANRAVFYDPSGAERSLAGVMDHLGTKLARALEGRGDIRGGTGYTVNLAAGPALGPSAYGTGFGARAFTDPASAVPYLITAEEVFEPRQPPLLTGATSRGSLNSAPDPAPMIPTAATLALPAKEAIRPAQQPSGAQSMSILLDKTFKASGASDLASPESAQRIERAYERLRALGL